MRFLFIILTFLCLFNCSKKQQIHQWRTVEQEYTFNQNLTLTKNVQLGMFYIDVFINSYQKSQSLILVEGKTCFIRYQVNKIGEEVQVIENIPDALLILCQKTENNKVKLLDTLVISDKKGDFSFKISKSKQNNFLLIQGKYKWDNRVVYQLKKLEKMIK